MHSPAPYSPSVGADLHGRRLGLLGLASERSAAGSRTWERADYETYYGPAVEDIRAFLDGEPVRRLG